MSNNLRSALPAARFIGGSAWTDVTPFSITLANAATATLPRNALAAPVVLDVSGFNTLALLVTISGMVAGNTFKATLVTVDPSTGVAVPGNLGDLELISETADDSYAGSVYLPAYYATLTGLILPFYQVQLVLSNTGGNAGTMSVDALKLWLTNA